MKNSEWETGSSKKLEIKQLTGEAIRQELWNAMALIKSGEISSGTANALAAQAREIVRIARVELEIATACTTKPARNLKKFAKIGN
jgi:hypothetical protein